MSIFLFAGVVMAKEFWETKAFNQWSKKECEKILKDSPWVKELNLVGRNVEFMATGAQGAAATDNQAPFIKYSLQLRSAAPVRQATVRQAQIDNKYDSLPADQKQAFDQSMESFLQGVSSEFVVVSVTFDTNNLDNLRELNRHWETQTTERLKNSVYLSVSKGEKVPILQFIPGNTASQTFQFIFPREVDGNEILKPSDKSLLLEFEYPLIPARGPLGDGRAFIEFKTDKMKINDEVIY